MSDDSAWRILREQLCGNSKPPEAEAIGGSNGGRARVYVSFDIDHDRELYERLLAQAQDSGFFVSGESELASSHDHRTELARRRIREADQMIVICGEHSDASQGMSAEIGIAQEEKTPYFLLWGRRAEMCTKPIGAKPAEGMYNWTREILADQVAIALRHARALATADPPRDRARQT
jgi:hypothetical protein